MTPTVTDYSIEPHTYPDGHTCNALCRRNEHCDLAVYPEMYGEPSEGELAQMLADYDKCLVRLEPAPEVPPGDHLQWQGSNYGFSGAETIWRYWWTYPPSVEAAVRSEIAS